MADVKITEKQIVALNPDAKVLITQDIDGTESLRRVYADDFKSFFPVSGELNVQTFQVTNLTETFSDAYAAAIAGKTVKIYLAYSIASVGEIIVSNINIIGTNYLRSHALLIANFGGGQMPYLFRFEWTENNAAVVPYPLSVSL